MWFDVDFPEVIGERKRYFGETENYHMVASDIRERAWLSQVPAGNGAIIVMEGISMYLPVEELKEVLKQWKEHFGEVRILMDSYTVFGAKATKYKNPINTVGVTRVSGIDDPNVLCGNTGFRFVAEHSMTPEKLVEQLPGSEQRIFKTVYGGAAARGLYRMFELVSGEEKE